MREIEHFRTVGVREFREGLADFLNHPEPVAITRHGRTIGYFIPASDPKTALADLANLVRSADQVRSLLDRLGASEEDILHEFALRRKNSGRKSQ